MENQPSKTGAPYFAALPPDELCRDLMHKQDTYYNWLMVSGRLGRWRTAFDTYYGQREKHNSAFVTQAGVKGELSFLMANEYRSLVQHLIVLATQNRPSIECATANTDRMSEDIAILGRQLLDSYRKEGGLDKNAKHAIEIALIMDLAWAFTEWDTTKGKPVRPDMSGKMVTDGDVTSRARTPLDVTFDYTRDMGSVLEWQMVRDLVNKYDVAAQYPEHAEELIGLSRDRTRDSMYRFGDTGIYGFNYIDSPLVERFTFFHDKTPAMPNGRMYQFFTDKLWVFDGPLPYRRLPGRRVCPNEMIASALGYSNANDLLSLQDVMDALVSAGVTNMTSTGVNNIWCKPNQNLDFEQLSSGMNYLESEEKPEVLILNKLPPEWFSLANFIVARMEAYSGVNSVARGNTEGKDLSGAAMALLQSMAIQFNSGLQQAYNQVVEDINNDALSHLQDFAKSNRVALLAGEDGKYRLKNFSGKGLSDIQRVYCRQANSMQDTTAGKMLILKDLLSIPGVIKNADQYLKVLQTGNLQPAIEDDSIKLSNIKDENEKLARGEVVLALAYENHPRHFESHTTKMEACKDDPKALKAFGDHLSHHIQVWGQADPIILQALGIPPIAPMNLPGAPPAGIPPTPEESKSPPAPGSGPRPSPAAAGGPQPTPARQPNMPTNPLTKEKWNPENGGLPQ